MKKTLSVLLVLVVSLTCVFAATSAWSKNNVTFSYAPWTYKDVNAIGNKTGEFDFNSKYGFSFGLGYEYKFNENFGLEFAVDFTDVLMIDEVNFPEGTYTQSVDYLVKAVGHLPVSKNFVMFGKLGVGGNTNFATNKDTKISKTATFFLGTADFGGVYNINKNWSVGASMGFAIESKEKANNPVNPIDGYCSWYLNAKLTCAYAF